VREVHVTGPTTSHWVVAGPFGKTVEWDAESFRKVVVAGGLGSA
jgi:uncharacterized membrane protein